jgi:hypothetical protein
VGWLDFDGNKTILKSEQDKVWADELDAVIAHYA